MDEVLTVLFESSCFLSGFVVWQYVIDPAQIPAQIPTDSDLR